MPDVTRPRFNVAIITTAFQVTGQVEPIGPWVVYLNNIDRHTVPVLNARALPIGAVHGSALERPQLYLNRADICLIALLDASAREAVTVMKTSRVAICHLGPLICRSEFHMGAEAQLITFFDDLNGHFFPVTNADVYPLVPLPAPLPHKIDLALLNRQQVKMTYAA